MRVDNFSKISLNEALFTEAFHTMPDWMRRFLNVEGVDKAGNKIPGWTLLQALKYYFTEDETVDPPFAATISGTGAISNRNRKAFRGTNEKNPYLFSDLNFRDIKIDPNWERRASNDKSATQDQNWQYIYNQFTRQDPNKVVIFHLVSYYPPGHPKAGQLFNEGIYWPTKDYGSNNTSFIYQTPLQIIKKLDAKNTSYHPETILASNPSGITGITPDQAKTRVGDIVYIDIKASTDSEHKLDIETVKAYLKSLGIDDSIVAKATLTKNGDGDSEIIVPFENGERQAVLNIFDEYANKRRMHADKGLSVFHLGEGPEFSNSDYVFTITKSELIVEENQTLTFREYDRAAAQPTGEEVYDSAGNRHAGRTSRDFIFGQERNRKEAGTGNYDKSGYLIPELTKTLNKTSAGRALLALMTKFNNQLTAAMNAISIAKRDPSMYSDEANKNSKIYQKEERNFIKRQDQLADLRERGNELEERVIQTTKNTKLKLDSEKYEAALAELSAEYEVLVDEFNNVHGSIKDYSGKLDTKAIDWFNEAQVQELPARI